MTKFSHDVLYSPSDRLWDLIDDNSELLMAISRFGIPLGFGNASVKEVCDKHHTDCATFLAVANYLSGKNVDTKNISLSTLMDYLRGSHSYFLDYRIPSIRRKLIEAVNFGNSDTEISMLLLKFFDEYVEEISSHMAYENEEVFSYISKLLEGKDSGREVPKGLFTDCHDDVTRKLKDLKGIIVRFSPQRNSDLINSALYDIIECEREILSHCGIEDTLFEPAVKELEDKVGSRRSVATEKKTDKQDRATENLSEREKEIIKWVACGLSNKEIADKLFISVHTVTTHRRNLSAKLDIHSSAALTIYAIINRLVDLDNLSKFNRL